MNQKPSPLHRASEWIVDHYRLFFVVFAALLVFSAVASGWVKVENDVAAYLPADSETRQGLDIMEQEFQTYGSAKILLRDTDADAAAATAEQIRAVDGVDSCTYTMNDTGSALLSVSLSDLEGSDTCAQTVQALRDLLDGSGAYIYSAEGYSISDQINGEVRGLLVIVAIILVTVLTFTSSTYAEVPILLITFLAAALINKGTNFVFGTISFVSNAVAILLQLAMSVDYAIIFCNRYKQAHETLPVREAVIESLEKSITVISSSSLTTIAGLVAMTFMKFGLGRDLGIVLIKAILISMLTVFLLMPGLLLKLGPAMDKTKRRSKRTTRTPTAPRRRRSRMISATRRCWPSSSRPGIIPGRPRCSTPSRLCRRSRAPSALRARRRPAATGWRTRSITGRSRSSATWTARARRRSSRSTRPKTAPHRRPRRI